MAKAGAATSGSSGFSGSSGSRPVVLGFTRLTGPIGSGVLGSVALLAFYLGVITLAQDAGHAFQQFKDDSWFVLPVTIGFGVQVGLFSHLRRLHRSRRLNSAVTAGSTGVSTTAMLACCAHHLADVLPILGLSAGAVFLNEIKTPLALAGLVMNTGGIVFMLYQIHRMRRHLFDVTGGGDVNRDEAPGARKRIRSTCH